MLAKYVKELLEEKQWGHEFHEGIQERVKQMPFSTLLMMHNHLEETASKATFKYWKEANETVDGHFGGHIALKAAEIEALEAAQRKQQRRLEIKQRKRDVLQNEQQKIAEYVERHCQAQAREEILEEEKARRAQEKAMLRRAAPLNDARRTRLFLVAGLLLTVGVVAAAALYAQNLPMLLSVVAGALFLAGFVAGVGWAATRNVPRLVTDRHIDYLIEKRAQKLKAEVRWGGK